MKVNDFKKELSTLNTQDLHERLDGLRRELFGLKLNKLTSHIKDNSQFKKLKCDIARVLTYIRAKESK